MPSRAIDKLTFEQEQKLLQEYRLLPRSRNGSVERGFMDLFQRKWNVSRYCVDRLIHRRLKGV